MKKALIIGLLLLSSTLSFGQKLKFKVTGIKDTTVHLVKYFGKNLLYADTALIKNGIVEFDGNKHLPGMMAVLLPGQTYFEFVHNKEEVHIETASPDFIPNMKIKKSNENIIFNDYVQFLAKKREKANILVEERKAFDKESAEFSAKTTEIDAISKEVLNYQNNLIVSNPTTLISKVVKMSLDIVVPPAPVDANGKQLDSLFNYHYYFKHYWDNVDLTDDRLVNSPIFGNKLDTYFGKTLMMQHWDTIIKYAFDFCDRLPAKSEMFKYSVTNIISTFSKSKQMGMDKVFVMMADRYFCTNNEYGESPAFWMTEEKLKELCEKIPAQKNTVLGIIPPNISLRDTSDVKYRDFYSLKNEYTILYFWDPECGHCKKTTPKLQTIYEKKWKERNIEIFAVSKAMGEDFEKWKSFIRDNKLEFINVALTPSLYKTATDDPYSVIPKFTTLEALNYHVTFDIFSTPRIFILDKDKRIIGKQLTMSQAEDMMDRLQNIKNPEKLFPPDPEEDEHMKD